MKYDNFIFDLDGTLIDSSIDIISSLEKAYALENYNNINITRYHIGPKISDLIEVLTPNLDPAVKSKIIFNYRRIYDNLPEKKASLYDNVKDVLYYLKNNNINLFIATNKPMVATLSLVKYFQIFDLFTGILTPDCDIDYEYNKIQMLKKIIFDYNLNTTKTIMLGDHPSDILAAKNNNISSVGILYGYSSNEDIENACPDFQIKNFEKILKIFN